MEWTTNMEGGGTLYFRDDGSYLYFEARRPYEKKETATEYHVILQGVHGGQLLGRLTTWEGGWKLSRMVSRSSLEKWGCLPVTKVICQKSYPLGNEPSAERRDEGKSLMEEMTVKLKDLSVDGAENSSHFEKTEQSEIWEKIEEENVSGIQLVIGEEVPVKEVKEEDNTRKSPPEEEQWVEMKDHEKGLDGFDLCPQPWVWVKSKEIASSLRHYKRVYRREDTDGCTLAIPYLCDKEFPLTTLFCMSAVKRVDERYFVLFSFTKEGKPRINPLA